MRLIKTLALTGLLAVAGTACADLEVTNLNQPDRERAIATPGDVEALISGSFATWFGSANGGTCYPDCALSVAADAHTSSWGNWGMRDAGEEPRKAFNNEPSYSYNNVAETPWGRHYASLAAIRDGMLAIEGGLQIGQGGADTQRAIAFAKFMQGLNHAYVALYFDKGFIVDETSELESLEFVPYTDLFNAALGYFAEAEQIASSNSFTIPAEWVGYNSSWSSDYMVRLIRSYRARLLMSIPRTEGEAGSINWSNVMQNLNTGLGEDEVFGVRDLAGSTWAWSIRKVYGNLAGWARLDVRTVGQADTDGKLAQWLALPPADRNAIQVNTTDTRITQPNQPTSSGSLVAYLGSSPFPASRGLWHYSDYRSSMYDYITAESFIDSYYPDLEGDEIRMMKAEASYHMGDYATAISLVNQSRAAGNLPPLSGTGANAVAPGGMGTCVPVNTQGTACADLLEAIKYEKRIMSYMHAPSGEYFDDRRWGDLVPGTYLQLPIPGSELLLLLEDIYTFGGVGGDSAAPDLINDISPEALHLKRLAMERYNAETVSTDKTGIIAH